MLQAKRRMAAQRERELRNYHQEQQYNRSRFNAFGDAMKILLIIRYWGRYLYTGQIGSRNQPQYYERG